jgi:hypothetical protein
MLSPDVILRKRRRWDDEVEAFFAKARAHAQELDRSEKIASERAKLESLRQDIREGLESGTSTPLDVAQLKRLGRQRMAASRASLRQK